MYKNLGFALMQAGRTAHALIAIGQPSAAVAEFRAAIRIRPDWPSALQDLAWLQANKRRRQRAGPRGSGSLGVARRRSRR
jgi:Flp pilus assembly protein TadD